MTTLDQLFTHVVFPENDGGGSLVLRLEEGDKYWVKLTGVNKSCLAIKLDKFEAKPGFITNDFNTALLARCDYVVIDTADQRVAYIELKAGDLGSYCYQLIGGQMLFTMLIARVRKFLELELFDLDNGKTVHVVLRVNAAGAKRKRASINETLKEGIAQFLVVDKTRINIEKLFKKPA